MKYIDADKLKEILLPSYEEAKKESLSATDAVKWEKVEYIFDFVFYLIDSIQQDETQVDKMLCSQVWWEEQGWIMIPPDATIEGIDSLLKQVRKKLQQESTPNTNVLNTKLVNLLKKYRISEETARTIADRIADTYGAQRYMDGLCDGLNKEDTKKEQPEVDLEKFTEKIDAFKARYNYPESISIKGAMAFMARMFYQYPNVAKQWYEQLPKVTMD